MKIFENLQCDKGLSREQYFFFFFLKIFYGMWNDGELRSPASPIWNGFGHIHFFHSAHLWHRQWCDKSNGLILDSLWRYRPVSFPTTSLGMVLIDCSVSDGDSLLHFGAHVLSRENKAYGFHGRPTPCTRSIESGDNMYITELSVTWSREVGAKPPTRKKKLTYGYFYIKGNRTTRYATWFH